MKQISIFSYVKRNNNNSEGVNSNEQCSSNVKEAANPKWTKCNAIAKVRKWNGTYFRYGFFLPDGQILNVADKFHKCKNNQVFVEASINDIFDFLTINSCFFNFCYNRAP